jgi:predicted transcriptional regulator
VERRKARRPGVVRVAVARLAPGAEDRSAVCQNLTCALTSVEAIRRRQSLGRACRRTETGGAAVGREAHHGDRGCLRYQNTIAPADLGDLIGAVSRALDALGREQAAEPGRPEPAVPVRRSIRDDHLVCLVCGKPQTVLRRHLAVAHQLTPQAYREQFGLKPDYPMAAPGYSRQRSEMAKRVGLGQRARAPSRRRRPRDRE